MKTETKVAHTPGPWKAIPNGNTIESCGHERYDHSKEKRLSRSQPLRILMKLRRMWRDFYAGCW